ncbi:MULTISPECIES: competence protein ComK [unclassified Mammaliicoccus]|uniref:competence protein ComK n=1 Tax=unclassified Mammaliicoccus TaxID=2803851 RepID=UPI001EFBFF10|nr:MULTISPECIES: competence protein ComK [unclassified Mammaliicoccus]
MMNINPNMTVIQHSKNPKYKYQIEYIDHSILNTNLSIYLLLNDALKIEGANMKSREQYAKHILKISKLIPVMIYASQDFVLFPTSAKNHINYMMINSKHITNIEAYKCYTRLLFNNDTSKIIKHDFHTITKKMGESLRLIQYQKHHIFKQ